MKKKRNIKIVKNTKKTPQSHDLNAFIEFSLNVYYCLPKLLSTAKSEIRENIPLTNFHQTHNYTTFTCL